MQDKMEEDRLRKRYSQEDFKRLENREKELYSLRKHIQEQEKQLNEYRTSLKHEQLSREKELQKELEAREDFFSDRERKLSKRQRNFEEHFNAEQIENEQLRERLKKELSEKENKLLSMQEDLKKEKERYNEESRKKIEKTSKDYVSETLELLEKKESEFHSRSKTWGAIGAGALIAGLVFFIYVTITSFKLIPTPVTWEFITFSVFKGLIVIVLFAALAKYALIFSNSYMREALKNADRRHAINFGKFYLESYGAAADWEQIKEAFEHWNITGENAFTKPEETKLEVTSIEKLATAVEKMGKSFAESNKDKSV